MARSTYIYIVLSDNKPVAAFTVKHEMEEFIWNYKYAVNILRLRDNGDEKDLPVDITKEFYE